MEYEVPEVGNPAKVLTAESFIVIVAVAEYPSSKLTDWPAVLPPKLIGPDELSVILESL